MSLSPLCSGVLRVAPQLVRGPHPSFQKGISNASKINLKIQNSQISKRVFSTASEEPKKGGAVSSEDTSKKKSWSKVFYIISLAVLGSYTLSLYDRLLSKKEKIDKLKKQLNQKEVKKENSVPKFEFQIPTKRLSSIGGYDEVLGALNEYVEYLKDPEEYTKEGVKDLKGIILSGPPGVGKSYIAEAIAGEAAVPLYSISAPLLETSLVGGTEENIRLLFAEAKKRSKCVLFIDEFDSIAIKRSTSDSPNLLKYQNSVVNQLLTILAEDHKGMIVIAATNHFASLDPSIVRQGRFDKHIALKLPSREERVKILKLYTDRFDLASDVSLEDLAAITSGYSGAKLEALVNEAYKLKLLDKDESLTLTHFSEARSLIEAGVKLKKIPDLNLKHKIAVHEAGHTLVGYKLGQKTYKTSVIPRGNSLGHTEWLFEEKPLSKQELLNSMCIMLAGRASEEVFSEPMTGSADDFEKAKIIAETIVKEGFGKSFAGDESDINRMLESEMLRAKKILQQNKGPFKALVDELVAKDEVFGVDLPKILK